MKHLFIIFKKQESGGGNFMFLMATNQVNRKGQNSITRHAKRPKPIFTKIDMRN